MTQLSLSGIYIWSVSDLTYYLREVLESDSLLRDIWVQGEVSNLSRPASGHIYFTLKDRNASLRCVIWKSDALRINTSFRDGQIIEAHGKISLYPSGGVYQLYIDQIHAMGEGDLYKEFLRIKSKLEAEGLFAPERKKPIPSLPRRIGVVTSATGAAIQDILRTIQRRFPVAEVILSPSTVQGSNATEEIAHALEKLSQNNVDVIILARGGGSIEDLWAFNDENVARTIAASDIPIVTGVGHETDFTIADFVSDLRAPTPTAAAELVTPSKEDLLQTIEFYGQQVSEALYQMINENQSRLNHLLEKLRFTSPVVRINNYSQRLDEISIRLHLAQNASLRTKHHNLDALIQRLQGLDPHKVLKRGYAIVEDKVGKRVTSVASVSAGDDVHIHLQDGSMKAKVKQIKGKK